MQIRKRFLKCIAGIASLSIIATSLASCGEDSAYIGTYNEKDIASGIYIYNLLSAYYEAQNNMTENDTDVFSITIEEKNATDWMIAKAKESTKQYLAIEQKFDEYGLTLTDDEKTAAENTIDSMWEYYGSVYEGYGISQSSFLKCYENSLKSNKLFEYIYGEDGEREVPEEDIKAYLSENYALINYISMNLVDGEGNLLKSAGKSERMEMAKDYVERAKNGEDFDTLNYEYLAYYDELVAEAEAAAAETATETEVSSDSNAGGNISFETVTMADANAMSIEEETSSQDSEETNEETTTVEVTSEETVSEEATEETAAETTVPEDSESTETSYTTADIEGLLGEDDSTDEEESTTSYESNEQVIEKDGETPDETVCKKVFEEMENGDITIVEEDEYYYVVYKMDILEDDTYYESAKESLLYEMRDDDFTSLCEEWADSIEFEFNEKAIERYTPQKFAETTEE